MPEIKRVGDLEIAVDIKAQRRNWKFQMFGSAVMALMALAGLFGLFGGAGPLEPRLSSLYPPSMAAVSSGHLSTV